MYQDKTGVFGIESPVFVQLKFVADPLGVNDKEDYDHPDSFGKDRCDGRTVKAQGGQTEMAKDKTIIKGYINDRFRQRTVDQELALVGAYQQGISHLIHIKKGQAPDPDAQKAKRLLP